MRLTATVITLNEEKYLPSCLESVKDIVDEIVIVDSGSKDKTLDIARKYNAKIYIHKFDDYASQKNFAAEKANGDWILSLDADEEIESQLADEIEMKLKTKDLQYVAFSIPRKNIILGKFIKYTRWQPELDRHVWLWKKGKGRWVGDVHEEVAVEGGLGKLKHAKIHHQYRNIGEFMEMINRYSEAESKYLLKNGGKFSYVNLFFQPIYNFLVRFFYRLGFLDGWRGFALSCLMAFYHLVLWIKLWHLQSNSAA